MTMDWVEKHEGYPFRAYLALESTEMAEEIDRDSECMRCRSFQGFGGFSTVRGRARLVCKACNSSTTNHISENMFAYLRRLVHQKVQTHQMSPLDLSAQKVSKDFLGDRKERTAHKPDQNLDQAPVQKQKLGPSGGWYRSLVRSCHSNDFRHVNDLKDHLTAEDKARRKELGREATEQARTGVVHGTAFGPKAGVAERLNKHADPHGPAIEHRLLPSHCIGADLGFGRWP